MPSRLNPTWSGSGLLLVDSSGMQMCADNADCSPLAAHIFISSTAATGNWQLHLQPHEQPTSLLLNSSSARFACCCEIYQIVDCTNITSSLED